MIFDCKMSIALLLGLFFSSFSQADQSAVYSPPGSAKVVDRQLKTQQHEPALNAIRAIFDEISPRCVDFTDYLTSGDVLPIRQMSADAFKIKIAELRQLILSTFGKKSISDNNIDFINAELAVNEFSDNERWQIIGVMYLHYGSSMGVMFVENKTTGQWTSFYRMLADDSNGLLYFGDEVGLVGDAIRGLFGPDAQQRIEISLDSFTVQKTH